MKKITMFRFYLLNKFVLNIFKTINYSYTWGYKINQMPYRQRRTFSANKQKATVHCKTSHWAS